MTGTAEKTISDQAKRQRAAYYREWRRRNPGKASQYQRAYWQRKAEKENSEKASDGALTAKSSE